MERSSSSCGRSPPESGFLACALAAESAAEGLADTVGHARFLHGRNRLHDRAAMLALLRLAQDQLRDRKSTRLNSSHLVISYAVFCLKKKKKPQHTIAPKRIIADCATRREHMSDRYATEL